MAANAAASVVWLTSDTRFMLVSGLSSAFGAAFTLLAEALIDLLAAGDSVFLFVTGAFNCTEAGLAAFDKDFSADFTGALALAFAVTFGSARETALGRILFVVFTEPVPEPALDLAGCLEAFAIFVDFTAGLALAALGLAGFALFAEDVWDFAGFFIAFAMRSTTK